MSAKGCVLITGATGKLGRAMAYHLARENWSLVVTSRETARAQALVDELKSFGASAKGVAFDLSDQGAGSVLVDDLAARGLAITHLVNNARSQESLAIGPDGTTTADDFRAEFDIDVVQPYKLTMALAAHPGHALRGVVNIGSQYGHVAPNAALYGGCLAAMPVQYGTAKAALHHLTREMAVRLSPGVRVNCVAFGGFAGRATADFKDRYAAMVPNARMLSDDEAGGPVAFLLDDASSAVNGHVLVADGGWSVW
ncbi:SDR family oxidoreductase [Algiphilus sp. NNCM1]|uniref:SDR family NAD(P)-dependent oxidoreductase n=1 Tax=Algiphilus sp. TaxID=1872431 RepID=UPI001CA6C440|nr:SDR family oxidoreductase [Algiphilus sp.]MBY8965034.1 SDR family oxidoreductase [Algiphilus acroporae]MCI5104190.1 SDR family oxidoreductase [Algiphilus sp.]